ncbi:hypothetical protein WJX73_003491 [Symbiochloris irregularis]|uniref:Uncharacterized protein n=1 Tax=Symbiochloris irregularis TaxID=706552 RepID=A0AAW1PQC3_9CHLO
MDLVLGHEWLRGHKATLDIGLPPEREIAHPIPLVEGAHPPFKPVYRLSPAELKEVELAIKDLLAKGHIEPSSSPFGAPILFVPKKDGRLRMVPFLGHLVGSDGVQVLISLLTLLLIHVLLVTLIL